MLAAVSFRLRGLDLEAIACLEQATTSVPLDPDALPARLRAEGRP